jgi:hypothetical protein
MHRIVFLLLLLLLLVLLCCFLLQPLRFRLGCADVAGGAAPVAFDGAILEGSAACG